jgi:ubiquitin-conjugating enzyme (huntingtin interacting protein 2)
VKLTKKSSFLKHSDTFVPNPEVKTINDNRSSYHSKLVSGWLTKIYDTNYLKFKGYYPKNFTLSQIIEAHIEDPIDWLYRTKDFFYPVVMESFEKEGHEFSAGFEDYEGYEDYEEGFSVNTKDECQDWMIHLIKEYTDSWCYELNRVLREVDKSKEYMSAYAFLFNSYIRHCGHKDKIKKTYRGANLSEAQIDLYQKLSKSDYPVFCWDSFISSTYDEGSVFGGSALFVIDMPFENSRGMDITEISTAPEECEVVLPCGSLFRIKSIEKKNTQYTINIEKIDIKFADYSLPNAEAQSQFDPKTLPMMYVRRLKKEFEEQFKQDDKIYFSSDSKGYIKALILGPKDTPYENGIFLLDYNIDQGYPHTPPKIRFTTNIWHPNISFQSGAICVDFLKNNWSSSLKISHVLLMVQSMFSEVFLDDPLEITAAKAYKDNKNEFFKMAKGYTEKYAQDKKIIEKIQSLLDNGLSYQKAVVTLLQNDWDVEKAIKSLQE